MSINIICGARRFTLDDEWREYPNQFKPYARCFYKQFYTPTRCACNSEKVGMQVEISISQLRGETKLELELCAQLKDGTWLKILNYVLPENIEEIIALIPRMLAMWEAASGWVNWKKENEKINKEYNKAINKELEDIIEIIK